MPQQVCQWVSGFMKHSLFTAAMTHGCYGEELWQQHSWLGASDSTWLYSLHLSLLVSVHLSLEFGLFSFLVLLLSLLPPLKVFFKTSSWFLLFFLLLFFFHLILYFLQDWLTFKTPQRFSYLIIVPHSYLSYILTPFFFFFLWRVYVPVCLWWPSVCQMWPTLPAVGVMNNRKVRWKWSLTRRGM